LANWPGHNRLSRLGKLALSRTVPVVGSMALSTKVTTPRSAFFSPDGKASTLERSRLHVLLDLAELLLGHGEGDVDGLDLVDDEKRRVRRPP